MLWIQQLLILVQSYPCKKLFCLLCKKIFSSQSWSDLHIGFARQFKSHLLSRKDLPKLQPVPIFEININLSPGTLLRGYMSHYVMFQCIPSSTNTYQHVVIQHLQWIYRLNGNNINELNMIRKLFALWPV